MENLLLHLPEISRIEVDGNQPYLSASVVAYFDPAGVTVPMASGKVHATTLLPASDVTLSLRHHEQLADAALADVLEAIASALRKRAARE